METFVLLYLLAAGFCLVLMAVVAATQSFVLIPVVAVISKIRDLINKRISH